jgi:hypothetical protein
MATDVILSSDNLDEKLDSAIEGLRNKEYEDLLMKFYFLKFLV